jgi:hypothetical protein
MKSNHLRNNWSGWRLVAACFISAAVFAGCGQSTTAGVGTGGTGSVAKVISGTVADGYLFNATVFLDKNGNDQLDTGETSTKTDADGAYALTIDSTDVGKSPIVALAIQGVTIDKDTNQAIANSYLLSVPKESVNDTVGGNFISPISTWIHKTMAANPDKKLTDVMTQLRITMNLPSGMNMLADYVRFGSATSTDPNRDNYRAMHTAAQSMVPILAQGHPFRNISTALRVKMGGGMMGK